MKEIAIPENGTSKIQSVSLNFDIFVQCSQVTQLHDIGTESLSDHRLKASGSRRHGLVLLTYLMMVVI
jgi:hypothetical protein